MTSRERMLRAIRGEVTDRVPVTTYDLPGYNLFAHCNKGPSYRGLMDMIHERADCLCMWSAKGNALSALSAADVGMTSATERTRDGLLTTDSIRIGQRTLTRKAMLEGKRGGRFIMGTSGGPIESQLPDGVIDRYRAYLETALELADYEYSPSTNPEGFVDGLNIA